MNPLHILQLNDNCWNYILEYSDVWDQAALVQVCVRLRQVVRNFLTRQCREFVVTQHDTRAKLALYFSIVDNIEKLYINLDNIKDFEKKKSGYKIWHTNRNIKVSSLANKMIGALKHSTNFKHLELNSCDFFATWNIKALGQLKNIEQLKLGIEICEQVLIDCCKSNKMLRVLHFTATTNYGNQLNWKHIVPYCSNLEELSFYVKAHTQKYTAIVRLPKLQRLIITGFYNYTAITELCKAFASQKSQQLQSLELISNYIDYETASQIKCIKSLKKLRCELVSAKCIECLSHLTELESLHIVMWPISEVVSQAILRVLRTCTKLQHLVVEDAHLQSDFIHQALKVLASVRDPEEQQPLQLKIFSSAYITPIGLTQADETLIRIETLKM